MTQAGGLALLLGLLSGCTGVLGPLALAPPDLAAIRDTLLPQVLLPAGLGRCARQAKSSRTRAVSGCCCPLCLGRLAECVCAAASACIARRKRLCLQAEHVLHSSCILAWLSTQPAFPRAAGAASEESMAAADISSLHLGPGSGRALPAASRKVSSPAYPTPRRVLTAVCVMAVGGSRAGCLTSCRCTQQHASGHCSSARNTARHMSSPCNHLLDSSTLGRVHDMLAKAACVCRTSLRSAPCWRPALRSCFRKASLSSLLPPLQQSCTTWVAASLQAVRPTC